MNNFKYGIILTAVLFGQSVFAAPIQSTNDVFYADAYVIRSDVEPTQTVKVVKKVPSCKIVDVPIYGKTGGQASTGEVLGGAIIGGILGNQVGGGSGKDAATILGAILGADIANKKSGDKVIVGYKQVEQCDMVNQISYVAQPTKCTTTVTIPSLNNISHKYVSTDCPALNSRVKVTVSANIRVSD